MPEETIVAEGTGTEVRESVIDPFECPIGRPVFRDGALGDESRMLAAFVQLGWFFNKSRLVGM